MAPPKLLSARAGTRSPLQQPSISQFLSASNPDAVKFSGSNGKPKKPKKKSSGISLALKGSF